MTLNSQLSTLISQLWLKKTRCVKAILILVQLTKLTFRTLLESLPHCNPPKIRLHFDTVIFHLSTTSAATISTLPSPIRQRAMKEVLIRWEDDPISASLIEKMQIVSSVELDAKEYLRPIFKWTKQGSKSYDVVKANAFAEYLVILSRYGDPDRHIVPNRSIQAKYAFNILITMAQRRGSSTDAWLSYQRIVEHNFEPDVFTMTALIGKLTIIEIFPSSLQSSKCYRTDYLRCYRKGPKCLSGDVKISYDLREHVQQQELSTECHNFRDNISRFRES